jgi:hypothetical protein
MRRSIGFLAAGLFASSAACSSDDSGGTASSSSAADAALAQLDCYIGLNVPGVSHTGFSCSGSSSQSTVSGLVPNTFKVALSVTLSLAEPPTLGELSLTSLVIDIPEGEMSQRWEAPLESCTAIATNSAVYEDFGWIYYRIDISCTEPAEPVDPNPGNPIELGEFAIVTFFSSD